MGEVGPNRKRLDERGFSIIEILVASVLLGFIALALLPAFISLTDALKLQSFRTQCTAIVRAKLQEYVNGVGATGAINIDPTASGYVPSGFEYTKRRFYDYSDGTETMDGVSFNFCQVDVKPEHPGFRERINTNKVVPAIAGADDNPLTPDVPARLQGFQLYTNIRHYNPRVKVGEQPFRQCPNEGTKTTPHDYQFFRLGDALEVTVTGMIRVRPLVSQGGRMPPPPHDPNIPNKWGQFDDKLVGSRYVPNPRLICSATQIIYPPRLPFRYYLGLDGKIRNYQATLAFANGAPQSSLEAMEAHFRSLWSLVPSGGTISDRVLANIRSFAISPENNSAYILRPGELKQYRSCSDGAVTMNRLPPATGTVDLEKIPDCSISPANVRTWRVDSNIENITVDFGDLTMNNDKVYGFFNTGANAAGDVRLLDTSTDPAVAGDSSFEVPSTRPRIRGIFLAPTFPPLSGSVMPSLFYFDNTCPPGVSPLRPEWSSCVSLFNSGDDTMTRPVRELPVQVEGISN
ncbi:MAG: type II secretion system protein [Bacteriovoracia bacterium]